MFFTRSAARPDRQSFISAARSDRQGFISAARSDRQSFIIDTHSCGIIMVIIQVKTERASLNR